MDKSEVAGNPERPPRAKVPVWGLVLLACALLVLGVNAFFMAKSRPSKAFSSVAGRFTARFPGEPTEETNPMKTGYSAVTAHVFTYKDTKSNTAFQILYADYPAGGIGKTDPTIRMAKAWDGIVQGVGAEPNDFRKLKVDGYPAIDGEVGIRASGEWLRIRMIVDSERLYMLSAMPIRPENTKAIDAFISSFAITK